MKEFACGDVVPGCTATFQADSDDGLFEKIGAHAKSDHGMDEVPDEVVAKVKENIRTT